MYIFQDDFLNNRLKIFYLKKIVWKQKSCQMKSIVQIRMEAHFCHEFDTSIIIYIYK